MSQQRGGSQQGAKPVSGKGKKRPSWMQGTDQSEDTVVITQESTDGVKSAAAGTKTRPASEGPLYPGAEEEAYSTGQRDDSAYQTASAINQESDESRRDYSGANRPGGMRGRLSEAASGALEWAGENKLWTGVIVGGLVLLILAWTTLAGGSESDGAGSNPQNSNGSGRSAAAESGAGIDGAVEPTGITLSGLEQGEDDKITLQSGELSWKGTIQSGEEGETLTLEGPTVAEFERGFVLPTASISTGVYAVAQDGGPTIHVDTHTYVSGDSEITQGSIFAVEDDKLTESGYYRDEREGSSDKVIRTYMNPGGNNYRVSFESPPDTPVPMLVGWRGPADSDATGESGQEGGG